jgi:WhiB family redox-sensing transcriptional regulator
MAGKKAPARPGRMRRAARAWGPGSANWTYDALCCGRDTELFFPEGDEPAITAKKICKQCSVRPECLAHALETDERYGIWGGLTEHERGLLGARLARHATDQPPASSPGDDDGPVAA